MSYIKAISFYLPERVVTNEELLEEFPEWSADKVASKVGVLGRHLAASGETAGDMAEKAARRLFAEHGISPSCVDFVLLCTQSPDYFLPSTACILQHRLGIPTSAGALDYNLGCSGCIYGLMLADALVSAGTARNVLLLTAETYQKYLHPSDKSNRSIFGDGAAACLVSTEGVAEIGRFSFGTDGSGARHLIMETGAARHRKPLGTESMDDEGHMRRSDYLYMDGGAIMHFTLNRVPSLVKELETINDGEGADYYVFHQANKFILNTLRKVCGIPKDKFFINLEETGNTVSSTIFIALRQCMEAGDIQPGMRVMVAGFGVGLSWGGTVLRF